MIALPTNLVKYLAVVATVVVMVGPGLANALMHLGLPAWAHVVTAIVGCFMSLNLLHTEPPAKEGAADRPAALPSAPQKQAAP